MNTYKTKQFVIKAWSHQNNLVTRVNEALVVRHADEYEEVKEQAIAYARTLGAKSHISGVQMFEQTSEFTEVQWEEATEYEVEYSLTINDVDTPPITTVVEAYSGIQAEQIIRDKYKDLIGSIFSIDKKRG